MLYQITGKQIDIGEALQTHAKSVVDAIAAKYAERPTDATIIFSRSANEFVCEVSVHLSRENDGSASWAFCILRSNYIYTRFCVGLQSLTNVDLFSGNLIKHFVSLKKQPAMQALSAIGDINQSLQAHIGSQAA